MNIKREFLSNELTVTNLKGVVDYYNILFLTFFDRLTGFQQLLLSM